MIIFGTKTIPTALKKGEFNCPNCQKKRKYTLQRFKKYFHIFFIPLIPIDGLGDGLECGYCLSNYIPGTVLPIEEYSPDNPLGSNFSGNYLSLIPTTFVTRLGAYTIDLILIYLLILALAYLKIEMFFSIIGFVYFVGCDFLLKGSSIGKSIFKIKISDLEEDKLPAALNLLLRNIVKGICILFPPIYLFSLTNEKVQTLHDKVANTIVINKINSNIAINS